MEVNKTISKIALGLAVVGLGAGTSAFTNNLAQAKYEFINVSSNDNSLNPADYEYHPSDVCIQDNPERNCSAEWEEATPPTVGSNPTGTLDMSSVTQGTRSN